MKKQKKYIITDSSCDPDNYYDNYIRNHMKKENMDTKIYIAKRRICLIAGSIFATTGIISGIYIICTLIVSSL